jgi:GNAT superfamily N-acetyltransferase
VNFKIRPARIDDAAGIAFVHVESWRTTYAGIVPEDYLASLSVELRAESWREWLQAGTTLSFVAEDDSGIFGFASAGRLREAIEGYDSELYAIYLLQREQKKGVGRLLVRELAEALRNSGFTSLIVWVLARSPAVGFYAHLGGAQVTAKEIEIGGVRLTEIALGWPSFDDILDDR